MGKNQTDDLKKTIVNYRNCFAKKIVQIERTNVMIIDLDSGYYQISIEPEYSILTGFATTDGQNQFMFIQFGIKTDPAIFAKLKNMLVKRMRRGDEVYELDDI